MIKVTLFLFLFGVSFLFESSNAQCLQCDSGTNATCVNPDGASGARACSNGAQCYVRVVDDGRVLRGCQSELPDTAKENCSDKEDEVTCKLCNFNACNAGLFPHHRIFCHFCDERNSNRNCSLAIEGTPSPCRTFLANDKCIVRKEGDHVIRQCLSDYEDCSKEKSCKVCDSHGM
uniref:Putative salivary protein n=1 Tax=Culicoides sonorensis TaxID=179676 RepID=Q66U52_CULSO|nr:putative salivary protein [Culicoides sonorensis]